MNKPTEFMNAAQIDKAIKSIATRGANLDKDIHAAAVSTLAHIEAHGDVILANRLMQAMPKSGRRAALQTWMLAFGRLVLNDDKATKKEMPLKYSKAAVSNVLKAQETPFWEFTKEVTVKAWVYADWLKTVQATLTKAAQEQGAEGAKAAAALAALGLALPVQDVKAEQAEEVVA